MAYTAKSTELTNLDASPVTRMKMSQEVGAFKTFSYTVPGGGLAQNSTLELLRLKSNQKLLGGCFTQDGLGNNVAIGDGTTADKYKASTSVASTGGFTFLDTAATNHGQELTADTSIVATVTGGAWTAGKIIKGYVIIGGGGI